MSNIKEDDTKLFPYNSRIVRLKDEDRFQVCLDLRRRRETTTETQTQTEEDELTQRVPRIGDVTAQLAVFDGHITNLAAKYAEKHWLEYVFKATEKEKEETAKEKKRKGGSKPVLRETSSLEPSDAFGDAEDVLSEEIDFDLEKALIRATRDLEKGFKQHGLEEGDESVHVKRSGCFGTCFGGKQKVPTGGTTVTSASIQRGLDTKEGDATFYIVCASCGDSGALLLPHPNVHDPDDLEVNLRAHKRLTREQNADDT